MAGPIQLSPAQAFALARLAEKAGEGWLLGSVPLTDELQRDHTLGAWQDGELLRVLLMPPGEWHSLDRGGEIVARRLASRAEVLTVSLRASPLWVGMRRLLRERGLDPAHCVLGDAFEDDDGIDMGIVVTPDSRVIEWRRSYDDDDPDRDGFVSWRDVSSSWERTEWAEASEEALALQRAGLPRP